MKFSDRSASPPLARSPGPSFPPVVHSHSTNKERGIALQPAEHSHMATESTTAIWYLRCVEKHPATFDHFAAGRIVVVKHLSHNTLINQHQYSLLSDPAFLLATGFRRVRVQRQHVQKSFLILRHALHGKVENQWPFHRREQ